MLDRTSPPFNPMNDTLNVGKRSGDTLYHIVRVGNYPVTLCGQDRQPLDPVYSFPMPKHQSCRDCIERLNQAIFGQGMYDEDE